MATNLQKNLSYLEFTSLNALNSKLCEVAELDNSKVDITLWGSREVTLGEGLPISLDALIQKIEHLRKHSIWMRNDALQAISHLEKLYKIADDRLKEKNIFIKFIATFFVFLKQTFSSQSLENPGYTQSLRQQWKGYSSKEFQEQFNGWGHHKGSITTHPACESFETNAAGKVVTIYAKENAIYEKINQKRVRLLNEGVAENLKRKTKTPEVQNICEQRDFAQNPVAYLMVRMITHRVHQNPTEAEEFAYEATAFLIRFIPEFVPIVTSSEYLQAFADYYFFDKPESHRQNFEQSLQTEQFQKQLLSILSRSQQIKQGVWKDISEDWMAIERDLRAAFAIFTQDLPLLAPGCEQDLTALD